ncbi:MAG: class I adenylate-forming enzyme family protein [Reyranellaceae bacterium]
MNLADLLTDRAKRAPDSPAAIHDDGTISAAQLERAAWTVAARLREQGLKPGDAVGLLVGDPLLHLVAIFALARYGVVHLPVQPHMSAETNDSLLRRIGAVAVVTEFEGVASSSWRMIVLDPRLPFEAEGGPDPGLRHDRADWPFSFKTSSGTTAAAKLIGASHAGAVAAMARVQAGRGHLEGEKFFSAVGMHSDGPRRRYMTCVVAGGIAVLRSRPPGASPLIEMIDRLDIRHFGCLPNHARELLNQVPSDGPRFPRMRCLRLSAAPSDDHLRELVRRRLCGNLVVSYGCSELGPISSAEPERAARSPGTVGYALPGIAIEIVDEAGKPLPAGAVGNVRVRAAGMPAGYHDDPAATQRHFRDGWFHPGDLGALAADGELRLLGRADDVMIYDGLKIAPFEIESVLMRHPAVREAAAFPLRSPRSFQLPAAAVVVAAEVPLQELLDFAHARLKSRSPQIILVLRQMPRNAAGKILKRELAEFAENDLRRHGRLV